MTVLSHAGICTLAEEGKRGRGDGWRVVRKGEPGSQMGDRCGPLRCRDGSILFGLQLGHAVDRLRSPHACARKACSSLAPNQPLLGHPLGTLPF